MGLVVRPASRADEPAIVALHSRNWRQSYRGALPGHYLDGALADDMRRLWRGRFSAPQPGWLILVAVLDDTFAGFFAGGPDPDRPSRILIDNLHVCAGLRGGGIGAALMREGANRLAAGGEAPAILWVVEDNLRARAFYRTFGGIEGPPEPHAVMPGCEVSTVPIRWDRVQDIAAGDGHLPAARQPGGPAMALAIRPALPADAEAIAALHALGQRETYGHAAAGPDADREARLRRRWRGHLAAPPPGGLVLVAARDGAFAGFLTSTPATDQRAVDVIHNLYVMPEFRGQGIGTALLRAGADRLSAAGCRAVVVNVVASNLRARALYRRLGGAEAAGGVPVPGVPPGVEIVHYRWDRARDLALATQD